MYVNINVQHSRKILQSQQTGDELSARDCRKKVSAVIKVLRPSRHNDVILTTLRLGKFCQNADMHQIGKHPNGLCDSCNKHKTVIHSLLKCAHSETRSAVLAAGNSLKNSLVH